MDRGDEETDPLWTRSVWAQVRKDWKDIGGGIAVGICLFTLLSSQFADRYPGWSATRANATAFCVSAIFALVVATFRAPYKQRNEARRAAGRFRDERDELHRQIDEGESMTRDEIQKLVDSSSPGAVRAELERVETEKAARRERAAAHRAQAQRAAAATAEAQAKRRAADTLERVADNLDAAIADARSRFGTDGTKPGMEAFGLMMLLSQLPRDLAALTPEQQAKVLPLPKWPRDAAGAIDGVEAWSRTAKGVLTRLAAEVRAETEPRGRD